MCGDSRGLLGKANKESRGLLIKDDTQDNKDPLIKDITNSRGVRLKDKDNQNNGGVLECKESQSLLGPKIRRTCKPGIPNTVKKNLN